MTKHSMMKLYTVTRPVHVYIFTFKIGVCKACLRCGTGENEKSGAGAAGDSFPIGPTLYCYYQVALLESWLDVLTSHLQYILNLLKSPKTEEICRILTSLVVVLFISCRGPRPHSLFFTVHHERQRRQYKHKDNPELGQLHPTLTPYRISSFKISLQKWLPK